MTRRMPSHINVFEYWKRRGMAGQTKRHCFICGHEAPGNLERAHIIPRCEGGTDDASNIHLLCHVCHRITEYHICRSKYWAFVMDPSSTNIARNWPMSYASAAQYAPSGYDIPARLNEAANA